MRNKRIYLSMTLAMLLVFSSACGQTTEGGPVEGKVNVMTSFYPLYDFTQKIGGEHVNVINLVPAGVDPHDWTPKPKDIKNINQSELFIYNGAGLELWVDGMINTIDSKVIIVEASHGISLIKGKHNDEDAHEAEEEHGHEEDAHEAEEEHGHEEDAHEAEEEHGHEEDAHEDEEEHGHEEDAHEEEHAHGEYDPHVWISPKRSMQMAENIKNSLIEVDPDHSADYESNFNKLAEQFEDLDQKMEKAVAQGNRDHIVVSHSAFGYLAADYGFDQVAVMGLSPDAEPTMKQLKEISEFISDQDVQYILFEELVSPKLAETLAHDLNINTLVFNPLEGLTDEQQKDGEDYFSIMEKNITTLQKALK